ncbi:MAG: Smr/MutS family protein, partial [Spirochaetes bacterium]|nr:Smr/MutS family protein [Spirochaetota bacterium]
MVILKQMMERARPSALILIDEIVVGTNPRQGASLAQAVVEALAATGAKIVVTTHYNELKELASRDERFRNASVSFDPETLAPAYRLMTGIPGVSYALEIARIYGIPEGILGRAKELLDEREISVEALIEKTQKHEQEIASERERLAGERASAAREKERYLELQRRQAELMENMTRGEGTRFLDELKEYRREIAAKIRELQQADLRTAGELRRELGEVQKKVETEIADSARKRFSREYGPVDPATTKPGDRVFVVSLEKEAVIESVDPDGESAELRLGNAIRARFRFRDMLRLPEGTQTAGARKKTADRSGGKAQAPTARPVPLTVQTSYNTIDLRGLRVDEAVDRMERDLDRMVRSGISSAVIIHGHGTGALKEAVRSRLRHSSYVRDFRSGEYGEGGDGVSIALLRE